jgi:lysophospholipase L1-like esterase
MTLPGYGLGQRAAPLVGSQYAQTTITADRLWLLYTQAPSVGDMGVSIDGGTVQTVHTAAPVTKSGRAWDSGAIASGLHTVRVTALQTPGGTQAVILDGVMPFTGDGGPLGHDPGVHAWDGALAGSNTAMFAASTNNWWDTTNDTVNPDLIVIGLGANDINLPITSAQYAANLKTIIERYRTGTATTPAAPNSSILLWIEPNWGGRDATTWQPYVEAAYSVAQSEGTGLVDMYQRLGTASLGEFFVDAIHPSNAGHRMIADGIGQAIGAVGCAPISGTITTSTSQPLGGECMTAVDAMTAAPVSYGRSASDGTYTIWSPPGNYKLHTWDCGGAGYAPAWHGGTTEVSATPVAAGASGLLDVMAWVPQPPAAPTAITATAGNTTAALTWTPPSGPVDSYVVVAYDVTGGATAQVPACGATCTGYTYTGLTNGHTYAFAIYAHNSAGYGTPAVTPQVTPK